MRLLSTRILVKRDQPEEKTASGIILSPTKPEIPNRGHVILTGPGVPEEAMTVRPGNYIQFGVHAGIEVDYNNEPHLIMNQSDILAILK